MTMTPTISDPVTAIDSIDSVHHEILDRLYDHAVLDGLPLLGTSADAASRARGRLRSRPPDRAVDRLRRRYTALCGTTGFALGLPGYATMPVTIPVNVATVAALQLHLAAAVAALGGHDPDDSLVRECCMACVGGEVEAAGGWTGSDGIGGRVAGKLGERGVRFAGEQAARFLRRAGGSSARSLPLLGGLAGAVADGRSTRSVARRAREFFLPAGYLPERSEETRGAKAS